MAFQSLSHFFCARSWFLFSVLHYAGFPPLGGYCFKGVWIASHVLWNFFEFQGCFIIKLSRFCLVLLDFVAVLFEAAFVFYHTVSFLSTTFLKFLFWLSEQFAHFRQCWQYIIYLTFCQELFSNFSYLYLCGMQTYLRYVQ